MGFKANLEALKGLYVQAEARQTALENNIVLILQGINSIMATLDQVLADVAAETTLEASLITLLQGLQAQIAALGLSPADQAKVDAIFSALETNKATLTAAVTPAVTPAAT